MADASSTSSASQRGAPHKIRYSRKIAVMGYPCVGKSSITLRFMNGGFPDAYDTTIEDLHHKNYTLKGRDYVLRITDTAGQQEYSIFPRSCTVDIDGFILVYAIDDRKSFEIVQTIHDKIVESVGDRSVPVVVVGNKLDLDKTCRAIPKEEGESLARQWNAAFVEISAKDLQLSKDVNFIFDKMLVAIEIAKGNFTAAGVPPGQKSGNSKCCIM